MQDVIDYAVKNANSLSEPPCKKRRLDEEREESRHEYIFPEEELQVVRLARKELAGLYAKHPNLDENPIHQIMGRVDQMTDEQVFEELERTRIQLSLSLPGSTTQGLLGLLGYLLDMMFNVEGLAQHYVEDPILNALVENCIPDHWISNPLRIAQRLADPIISKKYNKK